MTRSQQLARNLSDILDGDPWYGSPLKTVLEGISPVTAAARLAHGAHTIWEITAHIDAWNRVCLRRLAGEAVNEPPADFPEPAEISPQAWRELEAQLEWSCRALIARGAAASEAELSQVVPGKDYTLDFLLEGAGQHWIHHGGQIALLKAAASQ